MIYFCCLTSTEARSPIRDGQFLTFVVQATYRFRLAKIFVVVVVAPVQYRGKTIARLLRALEKQKLTYSLNECVGTLFPSLSLVFGCYYKKGHDPAVINNCHREAGDSNEQ